MCVCVRIYKLLYIRVITFVSINSDIKDFLIYMNTYARALYGVYFRFNRIYMYILRNRRRSLRQEYSTIEVDVFLRQLRFLSKGE